MRKIIMLTVMLVLAALTVFAMQGVPCGDEEGHFRDSNGNLYCSMEENTDYFTVENKVCLLRSEIS